MYAILQKFDLKHKKITYNTGKDNCKMSQLYQHHFWDTLVYTKRCLLLVSEAGWSVLAGAGA